MPFSVKQCRSLRSKLAHQHVKTRSSNGHMIAYVEGWHVISEANRIFGFDSWDRSTLSPKCLWSELQQGQTVCFYSTKVRITVRAGDVVIVREGIGTGSGKSPSPETAHEIALKSAETDATKRALATFGNPFGLALYDKDQAGVTRQKDAAKSVAGKAATYELSIPGQSGIAAIFDGQGFVSAALVAIAQIQKLDDLYAFWESNRDSLQELRAASKLQDQNPVEEIFGKLKERAQALGGDSKRKATMQVAGHAPAATVRAPQPARLPILKERRVRDKDHLTFVASQPCLICGRRPAQAHHLRFAQPRAMAMKVSDEYTVPLCNVHHDQLHRTGDERAWWARHGIIDPLKVADRLWNTPRQDRLRWLQDGEDMLEGGPSKITENIAPVPEDQQPAIREKASSQREPHPNGAGPLGGQAGGK